MEIKDMHVGQTLFANGKREEGRKVIKIKQDSVLIGFMDETRLWCGEVTLDDYEPMPNDLHDKDGLPLKLGDKFETSAGRTHKICGCNIEDGTLVVTAENGISWTESVLTKVEQDTLEKIRADADKTYCEYWNPDGKECYECDAREQLKRNHSCELAQKLDLIDRTVAVMERKQK